jgi:hypothetical protein
MDNILTPSHENLYAVEEIVVFRNVTLVRADSAEHAAQRAQDECPINYFQRQVGTNVSNVYSVKEDADIVKIMQSTEQPGMTLEQFTDSRDKWLTSTILEP